MTQWALKVAWEALLTPVTYAVVGFLKRREGVDVYDDGTDFTPFSMDRERPFTSAFKRFGRSMAQQGVRDEAAASGLQLRAC